ncbi:MAG: SDR family NAD(P)-dependent oxidoreductase [Microbacteriaceae bacterium]
MTTRRRAFVTGASRGIGKATAIALAEVGFDVAITARTLHAGEQRELSPSVSRSVVGALPGSLTETAACIESLGREALVVPADLLDRASLGAAATTVLKRWGAVDVVVHNARYVGPGHDDTFLAMPIDVIEKHMEGNFFAPLVLNRYLLPPMIERRRGLVVDISSGAALRDPVSVAGEAGWGICYGCSKAAFHRVAGILGLELAPHGVQVVNIVPGVIAIERNLDPVSSTSAGFDRSRAAPPEVVGKTVAWLATHDEARQHNGGTIHAQDFCHEKRLLPGWERPAPAR